MTMPAPSTGTRIREAPGGSIIVGSCGILVVVQVIGSAISSRRVMSRRCARLTATSVGIGTLGCFMALYYWWRALFLGQRWLGQRVKGTWHHAGAACCTGQYGPCGAVDSLALSCVQRAACLSSFVTAVASSWRDWPVTLGIGRWAWHRDLWAGGWSPALAPGAYCSLAGLAGHLLEPRGHRRGITPVIDLLFHNRPRGDLGLTPMGEPRADRHRCAESGRSSVLRRQVFYAAQMRRHPGLLVPCH